MPSYPRPNPEAKRGREAPVDNVKAAEVVKKPMMSTRGTLADAAGGRSKNSRRPPGTGQFRGRSTGSRRCPR